MRIPRFLQLPAYSAKTHMFMRCHNREYYFQNPRVKEMYMQAAREGLKEHITFNKVKITAYCLMNNHIHFNIAYEDSAENLSRYMKHTHSLFGLRFNRMHDRSGKVAESRPKTSLIENFEHDMRVHFYIEANPIRAGICTAENLKLYKFNSHKFYAYGIADEFSDLLSIPDWYLELGNTSKERQKNYRKLFYSYLEEDMPREKIPIYSKLFIGSFTWVLNQEKRISDFINQPNADSS